MDPLHLPHDDAPVEHALLGIVTILFIAAVIWAFTSEWPEIKTKVQELRRWVGFIVEWM